MSLAKYNCKLIVSLWLPFLSIQSEPIKLDATLAAIKVNLFYKNGQDLCSLRIYHLSKICFMAYPSVAQHYIL